MDTSVYTFSDGGSTNVSSSSHSSSIQQTPSSYSYSEAISTPKNVVSPLSTNFIHFDISLSLIICDELTNNLNYYKVELPVADSKDKYENVTFANIKTLYKKGVSACDIEYLVLHDANGIEYDDTNTLKKNDKTIYARIIKFAETYEYYNIHVYEVPSTENDIVCFSINYKKLLALHEKDLRGIPELPVKKQKVFQDSLQTKPSKDKIRLAKDAYLSKYRNEILVKAEKFDVETMNLNDMKLEEEKRKERNIENKRRLEQTERKKASKQRKIKKETEDVKIEDENDLFFSFDGQLRQIHTNSTTSMKTKHRPKQENPYKFYEENDNSIIIADGS